MRHEIEEGVDFDEVAFSKGIWSILRVYVILVQWTKKNHEPASTLVNGSITTMTYLDGLLDIRKDQLACVK